MKSSSKKESSKTTVKKNTVQKAQAKEHDKKVSVAKKKYFVPVTNKIYEAHSLAEATEQAQKELNKESK